MRMLNLINISNLRKPIFSGIRPPIHADIFVCGGLVLLAFALVYFQSLTFVYVDGDDATVVAYHALGRDSKIQQPYSPYQSMLDALLTVLPPRENIVRITAMTFTAVSAPLLFFLVMLLAFDWCAEILRPPKWSLVLAILLGVPEFFFLAMVLTPSLIAMTLLVGAHSILRRSTAVTGSAGRGSYTTSLLLFAIGAAIRWDTVVYGLTIVADLCLRAGDHNEHGQPPIGDRLRLSFGWGALAVVIWLIILMFNGWNLKSVLHTILVNGPVESLDWKLGLSRAQTFFTPAFTILCGAGYYISLRRKNALRIILPLSMLPVAKLVLYGVPKWFITATPSLLACAVVGICFFWSRPTQRYAILALLVLPWLIGVRFSYRNIAWGPGFELQRYDHAAKNMSFFSPTVGPGLAVPTPEGPRPLFGYAWVLLGEWKRFVSDWSAEQDAAIIHAIEAGIPFLLHDEEQGWTVSIYSSHGYFTKDSERRTISDGSIIERRWIGPTGNETRMLGFTEPNKLFEAAAVDRMRRVASDMVVLHGFSSTLIRLQNMAPECLQPLGKRTALLHLDRLSARLRNR